MLLDVACNPPVVLDVAPHPPVAATKLGLFSLFTLVLLALSTLSGVDVDGDLFFSKFENQLRCFEIASFALIFLSDLSGAPFRDEAAAEADIDIPF